MAPESSHRGGVQRVTGLVVAGVGVLALGAGTYFGVRAVSKNDSATRFCPDGGPVCNSQEGIALTNDAQDAARLANILVISGAVLAAGGLTLFFTAPSDRAPSVGFVTDGRSARLGIGGRF
jgi:serine/threonine-protein kinase